jgi:hypothetical protein
MRKLHQQPEIKEFTNIFKKMGYSSINWNPKLGILICLITIFFLGNLNSNAAPFQLTAISEADSGIIKELSGTVHSRFFDSIENNEKEMIIVFEEGKVTSLEVDGLTIPPEQWITYDSKIQGIKTDYAESQENLSDAEQELKTAEEEMSKSQDVIKDDDFHLLLDGIDFALSEARRSLEDLDQIHGEEIRRGIEQARLEIQRATEQFRREELPNINREIGLIFDEVHHALLELDENHMENHKNPSNHPQKERNPTVEKDGNQNSGSLESTLEELEKK